VAVLAVIGVVLGLLGIAATLRVAGYARSPLLSQLRVWYLALFRRASRVRVSCSSLLRLKDGNRYLVFALGADYGGEFGPPGGVIKYTSNATSRLLDFTFEQETSVTELERDHERDLRGFILAKDVPRFLAWWRTTNDREHSEDALCRELLEELPQVNMADCVGVVEHMKLTKDKQTILEGPRRVPTTTGSYYQVRLFRVLEPRLSDPATSDAVRALQRSAHLSGKAAFVSAEEIAEGRNRLGTIGGHSEYLVGRKRRRFEPPGFTGK
jgi:hypothetical protein